MDFVIRVRRKGATSSGGIQKKVWPANILSFSGTSVSEDRLRFFFFSIDSIPMLLIMTTDPMLGVDVLRSGSGLSFGICSAVKVSMIGIDVLDSGVDRLYGSNEVFLGSVGVSFNSLDTGAEVAR